MLFRRSCHCTVLKIFTLTWCCLIVLFLFKYKISPEKELIELEKQLSQMKEDMRSRLRSKNLNLLKIEKESLQKRKELKGVQ